MSYTSAPRFPDARNHYQSIGLTTTVESRTTSGKGRSGSPAGDRALIGHGLEPRDVLPPLARWPHADVHDQVVRTLVAARIAGVANRIEERVAECPTPSF